jgi:predicted aspartyl protease
MPMYASLGWKFLVAIALSAPAAAQPAKTTVVDTIPGPPEIDRTTITEDIAFKDDRHDRMTIPVRVGGKGYRFLVDTGADRTAVSTAVAAELGLTSGPMATLHSVTGVTPVRTANVPSL